MGAVRVSTRFGVVALDFVRLRHLGQAATWQKPPRAGTTLVGDYLWSHHQKNGLPSGGVHQVVLVITTTTPGGGNHTAEGPGPAPVGFRRVVALR